MPDIAARTMRQRRARIVRTMFLLVRGYNAVKNLCLSAPIWPVKHDKDMEPCEDMKNKSKSALSLVTPQARHHYTRLDQVNQLVGASEADAEVGFMARILALCSMPRTDPGNQKEYIRHNGPFKVGMSAGLGNKLPFGNIPRLLLAYMCTQAVRTQSRDLVLDSTFAQFMRKLGMEDRSGSARGDRARLRDQMNRLFNANVRLIYEDQHGGQFIASNIADRGEFWWNTKRIGGRVRGQYKIRLGEEFFSEIIRHPVPLDMNILRALKRSSLGLDLYMWLAYRTFTLKGPLRLSWNQIYRQLGADPAKADDKIAVQAFRRKVLRELKKIKTAWPDLDYSTGKGVLILSPSTPAIPPLTRLPRRAE